MGLQKNLKLCKGMRSEITVNIDVEDELSNWASGVLIGVTFSNNNSGFDIILIKFDDENIGGNCRNNGKKFYNSKINTVWTPILKVKKASMVGRCKSLNMLSENSFRFEQLQLQLVEDVNGIPWISAVADFNGRCFTHCHHVSLSREKKIGTLFIRVLNEKKKQSF